MTPPNSPRVVGIYGAGGHGRETLTILQRSMFARGEAAARYELVLIDDAAEPIRMFGQTALSWDEFLRLPSASRAVVLAIGDGRVRAKLASRLDVASVPALSVSDPSVVVLGQLTIGDGAILSPYVVITHNCQIGRFFIANIHCSISHDCIIGDFVTFAPGVRCNGNVRVEDLVTVGAGAVIRNGTPGNPLVIGRGAVIGMGAVVTKDVPPGAVVMGNPARPQKA